MDCGHGQANIKIAESIKKDEGIKVNDPNFIESLIEFERNINRIVEENNGKPAAEKNISVSSLKTIFSVNEKCLLDDNELQFISDKLKNISSLKEMARNRDRESNLLVLKIRSELSKARPDIYVEEAIAILKDRILNSNEAKIRYEEMKKIVDEKVYGGIEEKKKILESLLDIIYTNKPDEIDNKFIVNIIESNNDKLKLSKERIDRLESNNKILDFITEAAQSDTKEEAFKKLQIAFKDDLTLPEKDSLLAALMQLESLKQTLFFKNKGDIKKNN